MQKAIKTWKFSAILFTMALSPPTDACTRVVFTGSEEVAVTGRSMDWEEDMHSNLWCFPRGIARDGAAGPNSLPWKSKYGSVIVSGYDVGTADGINEKGLVANVLYLAESQYAKPQGQMPCLSISLWAQYALDNFATVAEAVKALSQEPFTVIAPTLPNGSPAQLHLSISDPTGDSAIFEYVAGKLVVHHGKQFQVMTNSPQYDQQLALNAYWQDIGGLTFLPGTSRAADRFARAAFLLSAIPQQPSAKIISAVPGQEFILQAVASVMGLMRSVSVPLGVSTPGKPNIASTLWRTVADQKHNIYYFDSATSPTTFWVRLADLNFNEEAPICKLTTTNGTTYAGNAASHFKPTPPFAFLPAKAP